MEIINNKKKRNTKYNIKINYFYFKNVFKYFSNKSTGFMHANSHIVK